MEPDVAIEACVPVAADALGRPVAVAGLLLSAGGGFFLTTEASDFLQYGPGRKPISPIQRVT